MGTWSSVNSKMTKMGSVVPCVWLWEPGNPGITAGPLWRGSQAGKPCVSPVSGTRSRATSSLMAQILTLRGPGHQFSSVDLECIIGKDGDQDDAKNLWKRIEVGQQGPSD